MGGSNIFLLEKDRLPQDIKIASQELQSSKEACAAEVQINPVEGGEVFACMFATDMLSGIIDFGPLKPCVLYGKSTDMVTCLAARPPGGAARLGGASAAAEVGSSTAAAAGAGGSGAADDHDGGDGDL